EDVGEPRLELAVGSGDDRAFPERERRIPRRPDREAMGNEVAMIGADVIELRDDPLEPHAARPDAQREVIVAVGTRRDEQPVGESRSPVAVETAEEHLAKAPLGTEVRFGRAAADDAILLAEILGIPFQASIEIRVRE